MHITLETDYAVRIVYCLAINRERKRMDAKTIAEQTGVTLRFSLKILRKLVACGIVRSFKGPHGGYELAKPLEEITLNDVIETVEGPYALSRCLNPEFCCPRNAESGTLFRFGEINPPLFWQKGAHWSALFLCFRCKWSQNPV